MLFAAASALALAIACNSSGNPESDEAIVKADAARPAVTQAVLDRGAQIYKANCIACHGESGKGDGPAAGVLKPPPRDHTDRAYMDTMTDDDLKKVIVMGGAIKGRPLMPSHPQLRGDDLDALIAFVRSLSTGKG
ncbi:MAG TPA: cytochrome c [Vicinamibacterales bacterium]|nr:cytochrome c [Vicinamibacterales bacterium]